MERIEETGLALGAVVSYGDMMNDRQKAVVTSLNGSGGQPCIFVNDAHRSTVSISHIQADNSSSGGWHLEPDEPYTPAQIAELEARAVQAVADRDHARRNAAAEREKKKVEIERAHPHLLAGQGWQTAGKNIRIELKQAFPSVKFSVNGKSFSMGNSITVAWTDGPTTKQVDAIIDKYSQGNFDGMTDCYQYGNDPWNEVFGGSKYVHSTRHYSAELIARAIRELVAKYGDRNTPTVEDYQQGNARGTPVAGGVYGFDWQSLIHQQCAATDCLAPVEAPAVEITRDAAPAEPIAEAPAVEAPHCQRCGELEQKLIALLEDQNRLLKDLLASRKA